MYHRIEPLKQDLNSPDGSLPLPVFSVDFVYRKPNTKNQINNTHKKTDLPKRRNQVGSLFLKNLSGYSTK